MNGYIKLQRKFTSWEWYKNANTSRVFLHLLLIAEWEDRAFEGHIIPAGCVYVSIPKIASDLKLSTKEVRTALQHLQGSGEIGKETSAKWASKGQVLRIENWAFYQGEASKNGRQTAGKRQAKGKSTIIKENKNIKNSKQEEDVLALLTEEEADTLEKLCRSPEAFLGLVDHLNARRITDKNISDIYAYCYKVGVLEGYIFEGVRA